MNEMSEETVEMADGCPEKAVIDIDKADLEKGKYDLFVDALNAALRHLEVTDLRAFISKQDLPGRWKFELMRAVEDVPADVSDSKEGVQELQGVLSESDEDEDKSDAQVNDEPDEYKKIHPDEIPLSDDDGAYDPEA